MTTEAIAVGTGWAEARPPYPPSWVNRLIDWIDRLPGPAWMFYVGLMIPGIILSNAQDWLSGRAPVGEFSVAQSFWGIWNPAILWVIHHLDRVARDAFDSFRPALGASEEEAGHLRWQLTVVPARPALWIALVSPPLTLAYYAADPAASGVAGLSLPGLAIRLAAESFASALLLVLVFQMLRQLRAVSRIHDRATGVDPFRPAPLYAFSRLTSQTGIVLILSIVVSLPFAPLASMDQATVIAFFGPWLGVFGVLGIVAFVVPLQGMHRRLAAEKERLQGEAEARLQGILGELNRDVDTRDLARADALNKTLASLLQQRDVLAKLPTWPWSAGTLRGFASALLLPIAVFLVQRLLGEILPR